ncbi:MAG: N-acetylmuramoyl-L-alanine amidase [Treponema sp.]
MIVPMRKLYAAVCCMCITILSLYAAESVITVTAAGEKLHAEMTWNPLTQEIIFSVDNKTASCRVGEPLVLFNKHDARFLAAPMMQDSVPVLPAELFTQLQSFFTHNTAGTGSTASLFRVGAVLIDPGHGGKDPGTIGSYQEDGKKITIYEKDIALTVSLAVYNKLKKQYPDKKILLTRSDDKHLELEERVALANTIPLKKNEAVLFISIHANSAGFNKRPSGFEVWYLPPGYRRDLRDLIDKNSATQEILPILHSMLEEEFTTESILIANSILDGLDKQIGKESKNRGVKEEEWFVVKNAKMPSVLVELGFVTNPEEAKRLNTPEYLHRCAVGIYNGIQAFIARFENS